MSAAHLPPYVYKCEDHLACLFPAHPWPDLVGPALAGASLFGPAWPRPALLLWLGLRVAWSFIAVVWPLRADWRWVNPPAKTP